jgi:hypothetical protein
MNLPLQHWSRRETIMAVSLVVMTLGSVPFPISMPIPIVIASLKKIWARAISLFRRQNT